MNQSFHLSVQKVLLLLTFFITNVTYAQTAKDTLTTNLTQLCKKTNVPGFAVAVIGQDKIYYQKSFGYADIKTQKPYETTTIQNIGSTSKTFIGVAIMKAVEQGKLTLETPINDILPFKIVHPKYPNTPITVKHLATHTSGIKDSNKFFMTDYVAEKVTKENLKGLGLINRIHAKSMVKNQKVSLADYLKAYLVPKGKFYKKKNFKAEPGTTYLYSNAGAGLAALVVEIAVGQPFEKYTQKQIFAPLKMTETGWSFKDVDMEKHATLYSPKKVAPVQKYSLNTYPDGGLLTNIEDLSRYAQEMMRGFSAESDLLSSESFQVMMTDYVGEVQKAAEKTGYGIFWDVTTGGARGHNGSDPGANSLLYFFPERNIGILFIVNMSLDDSKKTIPIYQRIWKDLRTYSKRIGDEEK